MRNTHKFDFVKDLSDEEEEVVLRFGVHCLPSHVQLLEGGQKALDQEVRHRHLNMKTIQSNEEDS